MYAKPVSVENVLCLVNMILSGLTAVPAATKTKLCDMGTTFYLLADRALADGDMKKGQSLM